MIISGNHFGPVLQEYAMNPDQNMAEYAHFADCERRFRAMVSAHFV